MADNMWVTPLGPASTSSPSLSGEYVAPNPVSECTTLSFTLSQKDNIHIAVFDIRGKWVRNLFTGTLNPGSHTAEWKPGEDAVVDGIYFIRLTGGNFSRSCKVVVLR
jgi:hypothetical protein